MAPLGMWKARLWRPARRASHIIATHPDGGPFPASQRLSVSVVNLSCGGALRMVPTEAPIYRSPNQNAPIPIVSTVSGAPTRK